MKIGLIVFARLSSTRLPKKVFTNINGQKLIDIILKRCELVAENHPIIIATSSQKEDDEIENFAKINKIDLFRGDLSDVASRAIECCIYYKLDGFVRICADRPFLPLELIQKGLDVFKNKKVDLVTNHLNPSYPKGCMTEIISLSALKEAYKQGLTNFEKEHITNYFYKNKNFFKIIELPKGHKSWNKINLSIDTLEDKKRVEWIINEAKLNPHEISLEKSITLAKKWQRYNI